MPLPSAFLEEMNQVLGADEASSLSRALTETLPCTSIRLNPDKLPHHLPAAVQAPVPWCEEGRYLVERPVFTADPLLHAGCYYVQEAASMFVEQAYRKIAEHFTPHRMLDLCAAPGGKSTLWRSLLPEGALLVANEPMRQRAQILAENLTKWGQPDVMCTSAFPEEFSRFGSFFDVVATDVPCSGEGMFRKDEEAVAAWSREAVLACADRQWQIVSDVWPALRQDGFLVYSTCTFNREENEWMVQRICRELGGELVPVEVDEAWHVAGDTTGEHLPVYHFFPHRTQGEGLFLALIRKTSEAPQAKKKKAKRGGAGGKQPVAHASKVAGWMRQGHDFKILRPDEAHLMAVRETLADDMQLLSSHVLTLTAGVLLAEERGKKLIPQHALALSHVLREDAFPMVSLSREQALDYLRRQAITLGADVPRGYVVATFEGHPLGFLNNLGARANNLYPQEWRIRNL